MECGFYIRPFAAFLRRRHKNTTTQTVARVSDLGFDYRYDSEVGFFLGFPPPFPQHPDARDFGFGFKHIDIREMRVSISARFLLIWHVTALLLQEAGIEVDPLSDLYTESERKLGELVCEKYGAPLHGGFGASLERVIMLYCGLDNIRMASLFPHDPLGLEP
ncbi:hypothetical protein Droror1_Dr00025507 [Drosera rotundifolia]